MFSRFAAKAAARYAGRIGTWEIWNEPNLRSGWYPAPSVSNYTALLQQTYPAIKAADPSATVILGGSGGAGGGTDIEPTQWLRDLYAAGARQDFDDVNIHAYTAPQSGNIGEFLNLSTYRSIMDSNGDSTKGLWITEAGTDITSTAVEQAAATNIPKMIQAWMAVHNHGPMLFYTLNDSTVTGYGFIRTNGTYRPSYSALQTAAAQTQLS